MCFYSLLTAFLTIDRLLFACLFVCLFASLLRLFGSHEMDTDLTELVVLARSISHSRAVCEHYFKYEYSSHTAVQRLDPMFTSNFHVSMRIQLNIPTF